MRLRTDRGRKTRDESPKVTRFLDAREGRIFVRDAAQGVYLSIYLAAYEEASPATIRKNGFKGNFSPALRSP